MIAQFYKYCKFIKHWCWNINFCFLGDVILLSFDLLGELLDNNFLNEERFACGFARGKHRIKYWGKIRIVNELKFRGISKYNIDINKFGLVGTRDYSMPGEFVPCVSCLHPIFDQKFDTKNEVGIVFHKDTLKKENITKKYQNFATSSNTTNLEDLIEFIGESENIITDSYHTMYWAMLMEKKVITIPNSSKFFDFKHQPIISNFDDALNHLNKGETFSGLLEECREINLKFSEKVFNYLNL